MARVNWKGSALLGPLPAVMVTCQRKELGEVDSPDTRANTNSGDSAVAEISDGAKNERLRSFIDPMAPNVFTAAWCGIIATHPPKLYVSIRPSRYSYKIIRESREFVVNLTPSTLAKACDYVGTVTGRCVDKFGKTGLSLVGSTVVGCPTIAESPLSLECRVTDILQMGSHDMFIADIVAVTVDEMLLDESGKLHLDRAKLCAFAHGEYFELGRKLGKIGFGIEKKKRPNSAKSDKQKKIKG